ncbi:cytochrome P450 4V2-like, partial [Dermacentor andersoni]|uniref:cytochrome P450 4V2-like n=1 Tax=Dermacentor andersoni TaxID=34620 RepID=UPI003B3A42AC
TEQGTDSTASGVSWTIYLLGLHPSKLAKVHEELDRVLGRDKDGVIRSDDLLQLNYLECCLKETLRLYPPFPLFGRKLEHDVVIDRIAPSPSHGVLLLLPVVVAHFDILMCKPRVAALPRVPDQENAKRLQRRSLRSFAADGYRLPEGLTCFVNLYSLHRDPRHFRQPDSFLPERFLGEEFAQRHPYSYIPFSAGPKNCPGQRFFMQEAKLLLAKVFSKFSVESTKPADEIKITYEVVLKARGSLRVWFRTRNVADAGQSPQNCTALSCRTRVPCSSR